MPFTLSHAAVVIPLFRFRRLDPLALVVGSMAPDLGYFIHRFDLAWKSHGFTGSIVFCLPVAWAARWLLGSCRGILVAPIPDPDRGAVERFLGKRPYQPAALWITVSLLLGILSHLFLDSFTHRSGWMVDRISWLHEPWPVYRVLQHAGSVAGMTALVLCYFRGRRRLPIAVPADRKLLWLVTLLILSMAGATIPAWSFASQFDGLMMGRTFAFRFIVNSIAFFAAGYLVLGCLLYARAKKKNPTS